MIEFQEFITPRIFRTWIVDHVLAHERTEYQDVLIGDTDQGTILFCDGLKQSSELDQLNYHECCAVPGFLLSKERNRALVIGCSEGVIPQMCVDEGFRDVIHVDIDEQCAKLCARYLPYGYSPKQLRSLASSDPPVYMRVYFMDAMKFVQQERAMKRKFDLIICDASEPHGSAGEKHPQNILYLRDFYDHVYAILADGGCFITQAGSPSSWRSGDLKSTYEEMAVAFGRDGVLYFDNVNQNWAWLIGVNHRTDLGGYIVIPDGIFQGLQRLKYQRRSISIQSVQRGFVDNPEEVLFRSGE
jgi:spermidine synthase